MMARLARLVVPGLAHHVTQRGNRRERTFFEEGDYALYRDLLAEAAHKAQAEIWSYCLMPNHVHIILIPSDEDGLRCTFGDLHRRYTGYVNARMRTTNPVRARLVGRAADWPWSSTTALITGKDDGVVTVAPVLERTGEFKAFPGKDIDEAAAYAALRKAETIGRPIGDAAWLAALEKRTGRKLIRAKPGRKAKDLKE